MGCRLLSSLSCAVLATPSKSGVLFPLRTRVPGYPDSRISQAPSSSLLKRFGFCTSLHSQVERPSIHIRRFVDLNSFCSAENMQTQPDLPPHVTLILVNQASRRVSKRCPESLTIVSREFWLPHPPSKEISKRGRSESPERVLQVLPRVLPPASTSWLWRDRGMRGMDHGT